MNIFLYEKSRKNWYLEKKFDGKAYTFIFITILKNLMVCIAINVKKIYQRFTSSLFIMKTHLTLINYRFFVVFNNNYRYLYIKIISLNLYQKWICNIHNNKEFDF